jgi:alpha-L-fucosidase
MVIALVAAVAAPTIVFAGSRGGNPREADAVPEGLDCTDWPCIETDPGLPGRTGTGTDPSPRQTSPSPSGSPGPPRSGSPTSSATVRPASPAPRTTSPPSARPRAVAPRVVPLAALANNDGFGVTTDEDGGFDGEGFTYPRSAMPTGVTSVAGVPFELLGNGDDNVVALGQSVDLPDGRFGALRVLAAASYGPAGGTATVRYADGSTRTASLTAPDWVKGGPGALQADFRVAGPNETQDAEASVYLLTVPLDPARTVASITLPATAKPTGKAASLHVFAVTLVPAG